MDNWLNGGGVEAVDPVLASTYWDINIAQWQPASLQQLIGVVQGMGRDHHVTVLGTNPLGGTHYFVLANIGGSVYAVDAMTHQVTLDVNAYCRQGPFTQLQYTVRYEATARLEP